jgi:hypothetical protein
LIFGSIGLFLIIFCYVALRIIVNRWGDDTNGK